MNSKESFWNCKDTFFLTFVLLTSGLFSNLPSLVIRTTGNSAPLSAIISGLAAILFAYIILKRLNIKHNNNLLTLVEDHIGTVGKYLVSVIILIYLLFSSLYFLSELSEFCKLLAFPTSPLWFITGFFVIAATIGAIGGINSLLRISRLIVPMFSTIFLLLIISVLSRSNISNLFPILGNGLDKTLTGSLSGIIYYSDIVVVFMLIPAPRQSKSRRYAALAGTALAVLFAFLLFLAYTAKIPYPLSSLEKFPLYLLSKEVYFGRFFQRMDAILLLYSSLMGMLMLSAKLYLVTEILSRTFGISSPPVCLFPVSVTLFLLASGSSLFPNDVLNTILFVAGSVILITSATTAIFAKKECPSDEK